MLVAPGRRDWYYGLTAEGVFTAGSHIRWLDPRGGALEESDVVEVTAHHRLVLRSRFTFAEQFARAEPHLFTWELTGHGSRCTTSVSWEGEGPAISMFENEGHTLLQGLRLAVDPAAQAEIRRLPQIGSIEIKDLTPERIADYQGYFDHDAFRDYPAWQGCYCMEMHFAGSEADYMARTAADNRRDMTGLIGRGHVTALLAYVDGNPVGWCNYGETTRLAGLSRKFKLDPSDHEGVGSIACFVIAAPYRGHGVASRLLDESIDRLRARGLKAVEAYPSRSADTARANYHGPLEMFTRAGFQPYRELERFVVLRKELA